MQTTKMATFVAVVALVVTTALPALSQHRDDDGSRMQARQVDVDSEHSDRLDPPRQKEDWRMFKLDDDHSLSLELTVETDDRTATLTLSSAVGDELAKATADDEAGRIEESLDAGIYYVTVESTEALHYSLVIE